MIALLCIPVSCYAKRDNPRIHGHKFVPDINKKAIKKGARKLSKELSEEIVEGYFNLLIHALTSPSDESKDSQLENDKIKRYLFSTNIQMFDEYKYFNEINSIKEVREIESYVKKQPDYADFN